MEPSKSLSDSQDFIFREIFSLRSEIRKCFLLHGKCLQVDSDGSGSIEFLEFLLLMGRILKDVPTDADLRDVFTGESQARTQESHKIITLSSVPEEQEQSRKISVLCFSF